MLPKNNELLMSYLSLVEVMFKKKIFVNEEFVTQNIKNVTH